MCSKRIIVSTVKGFLRKANPEVSYKLDTLKMAFVPEDHGYDYSTIYLAEKFFFRCDDWLRKDQSYRPSVIAGMLENR